MEFVLGGLAASGAGFFTNPLDVVKTRIQLQGELQNRGSYKIHYKNTLQAAFTIARHDGVRTLQSGIGPALYFQFAMNGTRLGCYSIMDNYKLTRSSDGSIAFHKSVIFGAISGAIGSFVASPFFLVKTQIQSKSLSAIAVGYQHKHSTMSEAFRSIYKEGGFLNLWRGANAATIRAASGSAVQLPTFSIVRTKLVEFESMASHPNVCTLIASFIAGIVVCITITPIDIVRTRLYNQGVDQSTGRGLYYSGSFDCFVKIAKTEGFRGFYKGVGASYLRNGPHTLLLMTFWTKLKEYYLTMADEYEVLRKAQISHSNK